MKWEEVKLGEHVDLVSGPAFKSTEFTDNPDDVPLIKGENIGVGFILWEKSKYYPDDGAKYFQNFLLEPNDIVLAMDRPWIEAGLKYGWIRENDPKALLVQRVARLRGKNGLSQTFLRYIISSSDFASYLKNVQGGVGVPHVSGGQIKAFSFPLPPLPTQEKIASILSAYDDLIENNMRRIKLLEEAAQHLYREWFVKFRFPGWEAVQVVDGLPEGWERRILGNELEQISRKPKVKRDEYKERGKIPIVDQAEGDIGGFTEDNLYLHESPLPIVVFGDHTRRVKYVDFPFASGADGTQLMFPKNLNLLPAYFYIAVKNIDLSNYAYARHFKYLKEEEILIPNKEILRDFNDIVSVMLKQISVLRNQNHRLKTARDLLLPRLMSGVLEV